MAIFTSFLYVYQRLTSKPTHIFSAAAPDSTAGLAFSPWTASKLFCCRSTPCLASSRPWNVKHPLVAPPGVIAPATTAFPPLNHAKCPSKHINTLARHRRESILRRCLLSSCDEKHLRWQVRPRAECQVDMRLSSGVHPSCSDKYILCIRSSHVNSNLIMTH